MIVRKGAMSIAMAVHSTARCSLAPAWKSAIEDTLERCFVNTDAALSWDKGPLHLVIR